jgi:hypothetical protein
MIDDAKRYPRREFLGQVAAVPVLAAVASAWRPGEALAQTVAADPLVVPQMPEAELAREVESLMRFVDPKLAHRYTPIDPETNAWPLWKQAVEAYVKEPEHWDDDDTMWRFQDGGPTPQGKLLRELRDWLRQNEKARRLTDEGTAKGAFELPRATESVKLSLGMDETMELRALANLKGMQCRVLLLDDQIDDALQEAQSIIKMGSVLLHSESLFVDFLIASAILSIGYCAAYDMALHPKAKRGHAAKAFELLSIGPDRDIFNDSLRVEFCRWFLPELARLPQTRDPLTLATVAMTPHWDLNYKPSEKELAEVQRAIRDTASILAGHEHPFDRDATLRMANELHIAWFAELEKPYWKRRADWGETIFDEMSAWPDFASVTPECLLSGGFEAATRPPTEDEFAVARKALHQIDNVVGKHMIAEQYKARWRDSVEMFEVRLRSMQLRIALSHYERAHGELPATLDALVSDGWFPHVPIDPYDGQPFRYSSEHRLIWSVGQNGDNDPFSDKQLTTPLPDAEDMNSVWKIPAHSH